MLLSKNNGGTHFFGLKDRNTHDSGFHIHPCAREKIHHDPKGSVMRLLMEENVLSGEPD